MTTMNQQKPLRKYAAGQFEASTMPADEEYRGAIIRLIRETGELASNPEYIKHTSLLPELVKMGPTPADRVRMAEYYADEMRHGYIFEGLLNELGVDTTDPSMYTSIEALNLMTEISSWESLAVFNTLFDRAGGMQLQNYETSSYAPLQRTGVFVARDEAGHAAMGVQHLRNSCRTAEGRQVAQEALDYWYPISLDMFGTTNGKRQWRYIEMGLKTKSNAELRQEFIEEVDPLLESLGLTVPDKEKNRHFL
jgi:1,2-phenylacetyl-CoA epoxidase catalytic subunit